ncbi:hypothetical protein E2562_016191 [Oryza meyeriana var. granulata]|uniref:Uncharacterized protein n=1 Tax=Oryza meyeriana var. granulata TaxID=110450 RepID=A0A6G1CQG5_9ORYZ|nr:hypothetical protein E2562_016191 [Oryza meyeriana var. granulata]
MDGDATKPMPAPTLHLYSTKGRSPRKTPNSSMPCDTYLGRSGRTDFDSLSSNGCPGLVRSFGICVEQWRFERLTAIEGWTGHRFVFPRFAVVFSSVR